MKSINGERCAMRCYALPYENNPNGNQGNGDAQQASNKVAQAPNGSKPTGQS
jgi:hypothetical protein